MDELRGEPSFLQYIEYMHPLGTRERLYHQALRHWVGLGYVLARPSGQAETFYQIQDEAFNSVVLHRKADTAEGQVMSFEKDDERGWHFVSEGASISLLEGFRFEDEVKDGVVFGTIKVGSHLMALPSLLFLGPRTTQSMQDHFPHYCTSSDKSPRSLILGRTASHGYYFSRRSLTRAPSQLRPDHVLHFFANSLSADL